jgi:hypothetical protein
MLNEDVIPNAWSPTLPSQTSQSYPMRVGAVFSYGSFVMHNNTTEVIDT